MKDLLFVLPVRHHESVENWSLIRSFIEETINSIKKQTSSSWECVVVANRGADLPDLGERIQVVYVDLPLNQVDRKAVGDHKFYETIRLDKGQRVLAGLDAAKQETKYFMVVDYDDFVNIGIVEYISSQTERYGWVINKGYMYDGGYFIYKSSLHFNLHCGTSHILNRKNIFSLKEKYGEIEFCKRFLGSHISYKELLDREGGQLKQLPFYGAVYRIGYPGNTSSTGGVLKFVCRKRNVIFPLRLLRHLINLRKISKSFIHEFGISRS